MTDVQLTATELSCANAYRLLREAIALRDQLLDRFDDLGIEDDTNGFLFDRLHHLVSDAERRVMRRRLRWLQLQRDVFDAIGREARELRTAYEQQALRADLSWRAIRSLVPR